MGRVSEIGEQLWTGELSPAAHHPWAAVHELEELCLEVAKEFSRCTFFAGKLVLKRETFLDRYLHNQTAAKVEQRLHLAGQHTVVLPLVVAA